MRDPAPGPVMANGEPNPTGTGRYCAPRICHCGGCPWWTPLPPVNFAAAGRASSASADRQRQSWDDREEGATWIDDM